jgi:mono/diheme cytochrome c family protein
MPDERARAGRRRVASAAMLRSRVVALVAVVVLVACGGPSRSELLVAGRDLYTGKGCNACHGGRGEGGVGPSLADVGTTFPRCAEHVEWVRLGSDGWRTLHGDTYGEAAKPLGDRVMPSFEARLTDRELRTVVTYERIEFGGLAESAVRVDCGL